MYSLDGQESQVLDKRADLHPDGQRGVCITYVYTISICSHPPKLTHVHLSDINFIFGSQRHRIHDEMAIKIAKAKILEMRI